MHVWVVEWSSRRVDEWAPAGNMFHREERAARAGAAKFRKSNPELKFRTRKYVPQEAKS